MPQYFSGCDVIVDSSLYHGFGLPGLEGLSCGLAGILTNVELDYTKNGENCILVEPKNVVAIKNAIIKLRDNKELLTKMKKSARETTKNFDWKKIIPEYLEYFKQIMLNFDEEKERPKSTYDELLSEKDIPTLIESVAITATSKYSKEISTPREMISAFRYYSKLHGFHIAIKELIKWIFK